MADDIYIKIKTLLERASDTEIQKVKKEIESKVGAVRLDINLESLKKGAEGFKEFQNTAGETTKLITQTTNELKQQVSTVYKINKETGEWERKSIVIVDNARKMDQLHGKALKENQARIVAAEQLKEKQLQYEQSIRRTLEAQKTKLIDDFNKKNINAIDYQIEQREIEGQHFSQMLKGRMQAEIQEQKITDQYHKQYITQQEMLNTIRGMRGKDSAFITGENLDNLNKLETTVKNLDPTSKNFTKNMRDADLQLKQINTTTGIYKKEIKDANNYTNILGQSIISAAKKFTTWYLIAGAVTGFIGSIKKGISSVVDLNQTLTEISVVTGLNQKAVANLGKEYQNLGKSMKVAASEIATGATEFYRQGLKQEEVMERLAATTQYAKISNLQFSESAEILTATVNSMGIPIERASDVFAYLGDATATGADEIGKAFQRVGGTAGALGVEFEKVSSWIAVISSKTRESAESIGNSIKTILARIQNMKKYGFDEEDGTKINEVARALNEAGIALMDSTGQFRNLGIVMDELGSIWDTLDSRTQSYIATTVAGVRQQSRFLNLMSGYADSVELYEQALLSAGATQKKFALWQEGLEARINEFKNATEGLWMNLVDSGAIGKVIDIGTTIIQTLDFMINKTYFVKIAFVGLGAIIISSLIPALTALQAKALAAGVSITVMTGGLNLIIPALIAATTAFAAYSYAQAKATKEKQEFIDTTKQNIEMFENEAKNVELLKERYDALDDKLGKTIEGQKELDKIIKSLIEINPEIEEGLDGQKISYNNLSDAIQYTIDKKKELANEERKALSEKLEITPEDYTKNIEKIEKYREKIEKIEQEIEKVEKRGTLGWSIEINKEKIDELKDSIEQLTDENFDSFINYITNSIEMLGVTIDGKVLNSLEAMGRELNITADDFPKIIDGTVELAEKLSKLDPQSEEFTKTLVGGMLAIGSQVDSTGMETSNFVKILLNLMKVNDDLSNSNDDVAESFKQLQESLSDSDKKISAYQSALKELKETGKLSLSTISSLIEHNADLLVLLGNEVELRKALQFEIEKEEATVKKSIAEKLMANEEYYNILKKSNATYINKLSENYGIDLSNFKDLASAKLGVEQHLLTQLSKLWANYSNLTADHAKKLLAALEHDAKVFGIDPTQAQGYNLLKQLSEVDKIFEDFSTQGISVDFTSSASGIKSGAKKEIKEIAQYLSDDLAQAVDEVNLAIKESEYRMSKYNEESQEYRNELNKQIKLQEKLQEIYHLIADRLRDRNEEIKKSSLFQKEWNLLTEEQKKELNKLKKEFDDNAKSIDSYGISWQNSQEAINGYNKKLVEISYTLKDLRYEYFNDLLVISDNRMMSLANSSAEYSKELLKQTFIRKQSQSEVLKEIKVLNEEIKAEKNNTIAKQEKIERLKTLVNRYYELERSIIDTQNKLDDIEFNKFENSLKQIDRQITPFINKISNLKSNFELLSETNFDGKIGVLNETIQANMGYVSQLEQQLLNLLSVVPKNAKEAQSLSESIEKTKQALRLAKVETIQYSRELSKLQLEKIQFRFDKITNSLMKQIDVYEYMIDAMIEGLPTGLSIDFNYVVEGSNEVSGLEDTQDNLIDVTKTFNEDMIEAQKDYNVQILEESREFFNEQIEQMSKFFEEFLDIVQRINSVKIFDTTLSDFARLNGANEETIETLKKLEKQMFEALYKNWKNTKENVGKIVDENNDGIDDITGEWISGYDTILQETKDYFTNLISEFSNNWDKINKIVKDKIAEQSEIIQSTLVDNSKNDVPMPGNIVITDETLKPIPDDKPIPNNKPIPDDKPKIRTKVKTFSPDRYIIENGVSYAPEMYFPVDILLSDSLPKIIRNGIVYFGIKAAYQNAGNYDVEWDGTNVVVYSYAKGTNSHPGGKAIISEEGKELIIYPNGKLGLSNDDGAELVDLPKGTQVIPNKETEKILKNYSYAEGILKYSLSAQYIDRFTKAKSSESSWFSLEANDILDDGTIVNSFTEYYWGDTGEFIGEKIPTQEQIKEHISLNKSVVSIPKIEDMPQVGYSQAIYPIKHAQRTKTARSQSTPYFEQHTGGGAPEGTTEYYWGDTGVLIGIEKPNKDEIIDHYGKGSPYLTSVDPPPLEVKPIDVEDSVSEVYEKSIEDAKKIVDNLQEQIDILTAISNLSIGDYYEDEKGEVIKVDQTIIDTAKSKAIETTTALISARQKLSKIIKESMEYELQAREDVNDGLTDTIAKEDTLKNKISLLHKEDFVGLTNQNNELLVNQKLQKEILKELEDKARIERDTFEEGSIEWNILDAQIKKYIKNIEQIDIVIKDTVDDIKLLSFDALNNSFENFIRNIDVKLSDLDFASEFIDDGDFQSQIDNINAIIEAGLDKITTLTDKIENIAINADTAEWWAGLDSDQQEEFISEWQNELQSTILLVFNAQKQISDIQKQKLQKMSAYENEIIQMIRKRVEIEKEALNEQLKLTQDNIDQRIKYINKLYDESSYEDSLKEEELLLKELYDERAKWLLDDSLEGQNKVKEIDKKILEQEKSIAKTKRQRSKDLRIEALNEEKENAQKITEEKQKQLDEQLRNDNLYAEAQKVIQTGQIEFLIVANGEVVKINGEAQTGIMDLSSAFGLFVDTYGEGLSLLGGQIKSDFIDGITLANKEIDELIISIGNLSSAEGYKEFTKDKTTITPETANVTPKEPPRGYNITDKKQIDQLIAEEFNNPHNFDTNAAKLGMLSNDEMDKLLNIMYLPSNKDIAERITNTTSYDDYQSALGELFSRYEERGKNIVDRDSIVELLIEELINPKLFDTSVVALSKLSDDETELLYTFMKFPSNNDLFERLNNMISYDDYQSALGELLKRFKLFPIDQIVSAEDGALTPSWGKSGKLAILHEKELVLNKLDTKNILKTVDITRNILSNFKLPNLSNLFSGTSNKIDFSINNLIRVDGNVDKNTLPGLKDIANYTINKLKTEFNKQGVFRGV